MASAIDNQPIGTRENMADRQVRALRLRIAGASFRAIAREMGISVSMAHGDVMDALAELAEQQQANAEQLRALELARLDDLALAAARILQASHPLVSGGKVLSGFTPDGKAIGLTDDGPKLAAIDRLLRISESRRKLLGLDMQPGALPAMVAEFILRWADGRNIIDITPTDQRDTAGAPQIADASSGAPGAIQDPGSGSAVGEITARLSVMPDQGSE